MSELKGLEYLRAQLNTKKERVNLRYKYYNSKEWTQNKSFVIPPNMRATFWSALGWCGKAVDSMVTRMIYDGVENDLFNLEEIFAMNNPPMLFRSGTQSALVGSCGFVYISPDENGFPRMQVIDGGNATGRLNPIDGFLYEGYAVLERDEYDNPTLEAYFTPDSTEYLAAGKLSGMYKNQTGYALLVPLIYRPDAERPFGHSRISRACMRLQDDAKDVLTRTDVTAEFYSFPQKYVVGLSQDAERLDAWKATMSALLQFDKDGDGDAPKLGQFAQASMTPHIEHLKQCASLFAGETGLTMDDLGFVSENPSSAEALKATHSTLVNTIEDAMLTIGSGFLNAGFVAACLRDEQNYDRRALYGSQIRWKPIIKADAAMLSGLGDGAIKINQAIPGYFDKNAVERLTGIKAATE